MSPRRRGLLAVGVAALFVGAGIGVYVTVRSRGATGACSLRSTDPLLVDQAEPTTSADPAWGTGVSDVGVANQVYQNLVMYNQTSDTNYSGVLARNWSVSPDQFHWNFTLRDGVYFSNGDSFNAYVMWFSLYRTLATVAAPANYLLSENFWFPGTTYYSPPGVWQASQANVTLALNTFNFSSPSPPEVAFMGADHQSFRVLSPQVLQLNVGYGYIGHIPYAYLLADLASVGPVAVDPRVIDANGGVGAGPNTWMATHAVGTGPYILVSYSNLEGYTLAPSPDYWAHSVATQEPWNNVIQPARTSLQVTYQPSFAATRQDLLSGSAATAQLAFFGPALVGELSGIPCLTVEQLPTVFAGSDGSWWTFLNQSVFPFNNWSVRAAIAHAIDYPQILQDAFGGNAFSWVGPVGPGTPYYNPGNLSPYAFDPSLARAEIQNSPCADNRCHSISFNYDYLNVGSSWADAAAIVAADLAQIGLTIVPEPITGQLYLALGSIDPNTGRCGSAESVDGAGPFYIGQAAWISDYVSPDDWTQSDLLSSGFSNMCFSGYNSIASAQYNASTDQLVLSTAGTVDPAQLAQNYSEMTRLLYENYTDVWFAVPDQFAVYNSALTGIYQTPMGSTELYSVGWNTVYAA